MANSYSKLAVAPQSRGTCICGFTLASLVPFHGSPVFAITSPRACYCVDSGRRRRRDGPHAAEAPGDVRGATRRRGGERHGSAPSLSAGAHRQALRARHERQRMRHQGSM